MVGSVVIDARVIAVVISGCSSATAAARCRLLQRELLRAIGQLVHLCRRVRLVTDAIVVIVAACLRADRSRLSLGQGIRVRCVGLLLRAHRHPHQADLLLLLVLVQVLLLLMVVRGHVMRGVMMQVRLLLVGHMVLLMVLHDCSGIQLWRVPMLMVVQAHRIGAERWS